MAAEGLASRFPMAELSVMGIAEVLPRLPNLLRRIRETGDAVAAAAPDALVTIDSPDFSLRVARRARRLRPGLRTIHYVAPSVWAWRPGRAAKMARGRRPRAGAAAVRAALHAGGGDDLRLRRASGGRPSRRRAPSEVAALRAELAIAPGQPVLALLPGSRRGEVTRLCAGLRGGGARGSGRSTPELAVIVPAAPGVVDLLDGGLRPDASGWPHVLDPRGFAAPAWEARKRAAFAAADVALAASGTVSLELAAAGTPMVIGYDASPLTVWLAKRLVRVETATLVNLVTGTRAVPEFLAERLHAGADRAGGRGAPRRPGRGGGAAGGGGRGDAAPRPRRRAAGAARGALGAGGAQRR